MITAPGSLFAALQDEINNGVFRLTKAGAPTSGTSGDGANFAGPGSTLTDVTNNVKYRNTGTMASPTWTPEPIPEAVGSTIASTATIAPTSALHHVSGTVAIATITPPFTNFIGSIVLVPDAAFTTVTTGNIALASTGVVNKALVMSYDGTKWYPSY
jgi:hypothetical protein